MELSADELSLTILALGLQVRYPFQPHPNDFIPGVLLGPFHASYRTISRIKNTKILTTTL
jgi:hypothetical protein